jgi:hypothetical protein
MGQPDQQDQLVQVKELTELVQRVAGPEVPLGALAADSAIYGRWELPVWCKHSDMQLARTNHLLFCTRGYCHLSSRRWDIRKPVRLPYHDCMVHKLCSLFARNF